MRRPFPRHDLRIAPALIALVLFMPFSELVATVLVGMHEDEFPDMGGFEKRFTRLTC